MEALDLAAAAVFLTAAVRAGSRHIAKVFRYVEDKRLFTGNNDLAASNERFVLVEESLDDAEIDIVLIHGLQNSRPSMPQPTEAQTDQTVNWVRHKLPEAERVRILSYQYDTTLRTPEYLTRRTLLHEAVQLNTRLVHARANVRNQDRPIIFVAHSLGGLLLKNALIFSEMSTREDERSILISTAGCLFYDTPHESLPSQLSESIWATVEPILDPLQAESPHWQRSEFFCWVSDLVQQTTRFEDIAANMPRKPQYVGPAGCGRKASDSLKDYVVLDTLKACLRDLKGMSYRAGAGQYFHRSRDFSLHPTIASKRQTGDMTAEDEFTGGDRIQTSKRIWIFSRWRDTKGVQPQTAFVKFSHFLEVISNSKRPQPLETLDLIQNYTQPGLPAPCKRNLWIKTTNQASTSMCYLNRRHRGHIRHLAQQLGKIRRMSGTEGPEGSSVEKDLPKRHLIVSTLVEAINLWLAGAETSRFLLIIDGMPSMSSHFTPTNLTTEQTSHRELRRLLRSTLLMCGLTNSMLHVIYTIECGETRHVHSIVAWEGRGRSSDIHSQSTFSQTWDTPPWDYRNIVMSRRESWVEGLGAAEACPKFLCLVLLSSKGGGAINQNWAIFAETEDLPDIVSSIDEALRHLEVRRILDEAPGPYSDFMRITKKDKAQSCPQLDSFRGERFKLPSLASTQEFQKSYMASERHCVANFDIKSCLIDDCSASVRSCSDMQDLLMAPGSKFVKRDNPFELSAYLKHSALVERDYERNNSRLLCICMLPPECFKVELMSFVGQDTKKADHKFRDIMRLAEGIYDVRNTITLDVFRLALALLALEGYKGESATTLEKLLFSLNKSSANEKIQDETTSKDKLFELFCLDCIYLARRGHSKTTVSLLQRILAAQQPLDKPNWSSILDLLDSAKETGNWVGRKQFSHSHYCEARELMHHWLGDLHRSASTLVATRISPEMLELALEIIIHW